MLALCCVGVGNGLLLLGAGVKDVLLLVCYVEV